MKQSIKKITAIIVTVIMILSLTSCGKHVPDDDPVVNPDAWVWEGMKYDELKAKGYKAANIDLSDADGVLAKILESGKLVIGTSPDYPPMEGIDTADGGIKGAEMLLAQYIADSLGVELVIESMDFDAVLTAVATGKIDLGVSGFGYKADRAEAYELSAGYQAGGSSDHHTILVKAEDAKKYNVLSDFNIAGLKIDAQSNSLQEMYVTDELPNADLQIVNSLDQAIMDIMAGKVDAVALDSTTAKAYAMQSEGQLVSLYIEKNIEFDLTPYGDSVGNIMAARKGEVSLIKAINQILDIILNDMSIGNEYNLYENFYYASCDLFEIDGSEEE